MFKIFDYIFYRINDAYFKWDGKSGSTAQIAVSMIQTIVIGDITSLFLGLLLTKPQLSLIAKPFVFALSILFISLIIYNFYRYKNKYEEYESYWNGETKSQRVARGLMVILSLILPWALLFVLIRLNK